MPLLQYVGCFNIVGLLDTRIPLDFPYWITKYPFEFILEIQDPI